MTRMKVFYYLTLLVVVVVTAGIVLAALQFMVPPADLPAAQVSLVELGVNRPSPAIDWIASAEKAAYASADDQAADVQIFKNPAAFSQENLARIDGKILVFESLFNQISESPYDQKRLEYLTGIDYSGFAGATYEDLADQANLPARLITLFESSTGQPWQFFGEGIVLSDGASVIVLRRGVDYSGSIQLLADGMKINFQGVFEITTSSEKPLATFSIPLTKAGQARFAEAGLPAVFPAAYYIPRNLFEAYYLAGNFSSVETPLPAANTALMKVMAHKLLYSNFSNEEVFWRWYAPFFSKVLGATAQKNTAHETLISKVEPERPYVFSVTGREIMLTHEGTSQPFFITGVNLGVALPGRYFTEFPTEKQVYFQWFESISRLNVNTIRVYTLLPPVFYQTLYEFNQNNEQPLFLLQEIWPEEHPQDSNLLDEAYVDSYHQEIVNVVHAVHGNIQIPERQYRAYGIYAYDVSPYLLGYLVGRELEPEEVLETDRLNQGFQFEGDYFFTLPDASPSESWLAASCDFTMTLEADSYHNQPLLGIVSWPTLDPLDHPSEWVSQDVAPYNDKAVVDIDHIGVRSDKVAGFFGAYHIYPNYPDFMNNQETYADYSDEQGSFRYGGYLREFIQQHTRYPAVVAEYGISTSSVTAHLNPDGLDHGGLTEAQQMEGILRMTEAIRDEAYSGAIIFEWMDEWAKKTWTTEFYMIPYERHVFWHNVLDPEQNYGLLAYDPPDPVMNEVYTASSAGEVVQQILIGQNEEYLQIQLTCKTDCTRSEPFSLALSTYALSGETEPVWEFLVDLGESPEVRVNPGYHWLKGRFATAPAEFSDYESLVMVTNAGYRMEDGNLAPEQTQNLGQLSLGAFDNLENQVLMNGDQITVRLPYGLIAFSDPSSKTVLYDERQFVPDGVDQIGVRQTDEILVQVMQADTPLTLARFELTGWEQPQYTPRLKDGFDGLADYFASLK